MTSITAAKATGLAAAHASASSNGPGWTTLAVSALDIYARMSTQPFTAEQAREQIGNSVPEPKDARAWGAAISAAIRQGCLKAVGYAPARSSHGSPKRTYLHA